MKHSKDTAHPPLDVRTAFFIGIGVWLIPSWARTLLGAMPVARMLYGTVWVAAGYAASLLVLAAAYRALSRAGTDLRLSALLSLLATVPVTLLSYVIEFYITDLWPQTSWELPGEPHTLSYAVITGLCDSAAASTLLASIAFLPPLTRAHEERRRDLRLVTREAELLRLRTVLEPHFVLNSLNAVAGMVDDEPRQARELLAALGELFRDASSFRPVHTVRDEIAWLRRYVLIHEHRFPDLLHAEWDIAADALECACPALVLQPLVENAIQHGALRGGGTVTVRAKVEGGELHLTVENDGPELGPPRENGRGLWVVRRRLELESLPSDAFRLSREGAVTVARLRLPTEERAYEALLLVEGP